MDREIIHIDEEKCDGCGLCIPNCHEGALQLIDGKARLISELFCDGLGACIGHCPQGAITIERREAEAYNERKVMEAIITKGESTILAHLKHMEEHNETGYLQEARAFLKEKNIELAAAPAKLTAPDGMKATGFGCMGSMPMDFRPEQKEQAVDVVTPVEVRSELRQWPVQLHLLNPGASYLQGADLVLASDCSAFTIGDFHGRFLKNKALAIACPKLDTGKDIYIQKLAMMIAQARVNTITVIMMEVPCCGGLMQLVHAAVQQAGRVLPVKEVILGIRGDVMREEWR